MPSLLAAVLVTLISTPDEKLTGIACRSVHLGWQAPRAGALYNEVVVEESAPGTYFCAIGFGGGYFGIQEQGRGKKVVIFSVWDPGDQNNPDEVPADRRVKLVSQGKDVRIGRFGNEGTGGQSFLDLDWEVGKAYRFLVTAGPDPEGDASRTAFAAYVGMPAGGWEHVATFSTIGRDGDLGGAYSFVEDFRRDRESTKRTRRARFGPVWAKPVGGPWRGVAEARFTADSNRDTRIDAGPAAGHAGAFFLSTGGETPEGAEKLREVFSSPVPDGNGAPADLPEGAIDPAGEGLPGA